GAFKWRGALPTLERWRSDVVTASTGNHGAATAWAAQRLGLRATVFVPERASAAKLALLERCGAEVRQVGTDLDEAKEAARAFAVGLAVRVAIPQAGGALGESAYEMLLVSGLELMRAVAAIHHAGIRAEAAAAAALAAMPQVAADGPIVLIVTGRNIDDELLERCLAA